ncbi:hypothetical protein ACEWY4_024565 [Coilia grayii]|uniref:Alpha-macroglobulin-like TED domain-containing protein n=1 Tax=Coilia grayii TaxID=363190 RepID=A0ABD1J133_9TELE
MYFLLQEVTLKFLKSSVSGASNTYATALLAYTFSLVGEEDIRAQLLKHSVATSDGSLLHWSKSERADSLAVETSSYMLLADTVVALQALALYATRVISPHGSSTVTVQSAGGTKHQLDVNQHNTLLYQDRALQDVPGK